MSDPKLISPMLDNFAMGEPISDHHGVRSYPAMEQSTEGKYIVKIISIPATQVQLQALLLTGAFQDEASARDYFLELAENIVAEKDVLGKLAKMEGFLSYEDSQIVPMENEVGYDVYLLSPYRKSLARYLRKNNLTHLQAVNLGLDMCASLAVCRQAGYLFVNLKPENIFICNDKEYRIGDVGFFKLNALKFASFPDRYISPYTPPEIVDAYSDVNTTADVYAAGMVLYQVYNGGELPFADRAGSEELPSPTYADYEMAEIILKACAVNPADRWQNPVEMGQALVAYMQRNSVNDVPIVTVSESHTEAEAVQLQAAEEAASQDELPDEDLADILGDAAVDFRPEEDASDDAEASEESDEQICLDEFYAFIGEEPPADDSAGNVVAEDAEVASESSDEEDSLPYLDFDMVDESSDEDDIVNLSFLAEMEEVVFLCDTAPSAEMADEMEYEGLSDDASSILSLADDLISHETPEGVVPPEPIDVPMPEPIVFPPDVPADPEEPLENETDESPDDVFQEDEDEDDEDVFAEDAEEDPSSEGATSNGYVDPYQRDRELASRRNDHRRQIAKKKAARSKAIRRWIVALLILALLGGLAYGGYVFYRDYYLRNVSSLVLTGAEDKLTVSVTANIDESLLTVQCIDTYGTIQQSGVSDGKAVFTGLTPNTLYNVKVEVGGMHKLTGEIADSYTTPVQTNIVQFNAVAGSEEGTAILTFAVEGMDSDTWTITYSADGIPENKTIFSGHSQNITGLVTGKTYTFRLDSGSDLYIVGNDVLEYTVMSPVFAQNLEITGCTENSMTVNWEVPESSAVSKWSVRCYSDSGYDCTVETEETTVTFEGLNGNEAHNVEVIAEGMSTGTRCYMTANAVTVSNMNVSYNDATTLLLTWDYTGNPPASQWIVT